MTSTYFTRLLRLRLWVSERLRPGEAYVTLFWAGLIGAIGGLSAPAFRAATLFVQWAFTGHTESLVETARAAHGRVEIGRFGAHMEVHLVNDGPVTFWLEAR